MENKSKNANIGIYKHSIASSVIVYVILTSEVFIGHRMLNSEIQKCQAEVNIHKIRNAQMDALFGIHTQIIT